MFQNFLELTTQREVFTFQGAPSESHGKVEKGVINYQRVLMGTVLPKLMGQQLAICEGSLALHRGS